MDLPSKSFLNSMAAGFVIVAMFGSFFGPLALLIMEYYSISPFEYSILTTLIFLSGLGATLFVLFFGDRVNKILLLCVTIGVLTIALFLFASALPFWGLLFVGLIAGFMVIMSDVTTNAIILEAFTGQKTTLIPRMYSMYDSGMVVGPLYVALLVTPAVAATFVRPYLILGFAGVAVFIFMCVSAKKIMPQTPYAHLNKKAITHGLTVFKTKKAWLIIISGVSMYFVYSGVIVWMPTLANREFGATFEISGITVTLFFLTGIVIRFFAPLIYKRISPLRWIFLFGFALALSIGLIMICTSVSGLFVLVAISGACSGMAITSLTLFTSDIFPAHPSAVAVITLLEFNIGSAISPMLMSMVAERVSFSAAFLVVSLVCAIGIVILGIGLKHGK